MEDYEIKGKNLVIFTLSSLTILFWVILLLPKESDRGFTFDSTLTVYLIVFLMFLLVYFFVLIPMILKEFKVPGKFSFSQLLSVIFLYGMVLLVTTLLIALSHDFENVAYYEEIVEKEWKGGDKVYKIPIYTLEMLAYFFFSLGCITLLWVPYVKRLLKFLKYQLILMPIVLIIFQFYIYGGRFLSNEVRLDKEKIEKNEDRYYSN